MERQAAYYLTARARHSAKVFGMRSLVYTGGLAFGYYSEQILFKESRRERLQCTQARQIN